MIDNPVVTGRINSLSPQAFIAGLVRVGITAAFILAVIFFLFNLLLGGMRWINSAGDKAKLEQARSQIFNAVIGITVVFMTFAIVNFVEIVFGINLTTFDLSTLRI